MCRRFRRLLQATLYLRYHLSIKLPWKAKRSHLTVSRREKVQSQTGFVKEYRSRKYRYEFLIPVLNFIKYIFEILRYLEIYYKQDLKRRASIGLNGTLVIKSAAMGDLGEYTCVVTGETGDQQSASAFLNVQCKCATFSALPLNLCTSLMIFFHSDKAKVIYAQREVYLPYGKPALLDCHFRANPPLTNLRWEKDGFLFDPYNVQGVFYRRNGSLYFSKVDETHSGSYTCTPYNELGTEGPSPSITVVSIHCHCSI